MPLIPFTPLYMSNLFLFFRKLPPYRLELVPLNVEEAVEKNEAEDAVSSKLGMLSMKSMSYTDVLLDIQESVSKAAKLRDGFVLVVAAAAGWGCTVVAMDVLVSLVVFKKDVDEEDDSCVLN